MIRPEAAERPFTVSELALEVRRALRPLSSVLVKGEVSGMKLSAKGHYSFAVRDAGAVIQAFLFAGDARRLGLVPEDGQEFIFRGRIELLPVLGHQDRKSTRLNSSHTVISYAVFCLKKTTP